MADIWDRQEGESSRAYAAFCVYRDEGPERSLDRAFTESRGLAEPGRAPGQWALWSAEFRWVERAAAYDEHVDRERRRVREAKLRELEERRAAFEVDNQGRLERSVARAEDLLDRKAQEKEVNLGQYSRLMKQADETARMAITGVREDDEQDDEAVERKVRGVFEWKKPTAEK